MKHNKIGFNNFKSFGERLQMFSDKPITLVYGANSVGKSSFLHAHLYKEFLLRQKSIEFERSNFAGDELELGGFSEFVHKKDASNKISFRKTISNPNDLDLIFGDFFSKIKNFAQNNIIKMALTLDSTEFVRRLNNYKLKETEWFFTDHSRDMFIETWKSVSLLKNFVEDDNLDDYLEHTGLNELLSGIFSGAYLFNELLHSKKMELEDFVDTMKSKTYLRDRLELVDGSEFDDIDEILIFIIGYSEPLLPLSGAVAGQLSATLFGKDRKDPDKFFEYFKKALMHLEFLSAIESIACEFIHGLSLDKDNEASTEIIEIKLEINGSVIISGQLMQGHEKVKVTLTEDGEMFLKDLYNFEYFGSDFKSSTCYVDCSYLGLSFLNEFRDHYRVPSQEARGWSILNMYPISSPSREANDVEDLPGRCQDRFISNLMTKVFENYFVNRSDTIQYFGPLRFYPRGSDLVLADQGEFNWESFLQDDISKGKFIKSIVSFPNYWLLKKSPKLAILLATIPKIVGIFKLVMQDISILNSLNNLRRSGNRTALGKANSSRRLWKYLIASKELQEEVNHWLLDDNKLKSNYEIKTEEVIEHSWLRKLFFLKEVRIKSLKFIDKRTGVPVTPREMGLGISQFLPILLALKSLTNSTQFIEQPELHLHPALQCEIADEFIRSMNTKKNKFYIETHSEHLLLRVMTRLRHSSEGLLKKGDDLYLTPEDVCLLYIDNNGDFTYLNELELDKDGSLLDPWPNGFFEEGHNERFD
jgi:AAA15 family ATPase/GTPase